MENEPSIESQVIQDLWAQYAQASRSIASSTIAALWNNVDIAYKLYAKAGDVGVKAELVKLLLSTHALDMHYYGSDHASFDLAKRIAVFFVEPGCPELVCKSDLHAKILAFICTKLSYMTEVTRPLRAASAIADILSAWTGRAVEATTVFKPTDVIGILYGNAVYPLYRDDVEDVEDLPGYLLRLNIPVLGADNFLPNPLASRNVELPNDISAGT